MIRTGELGIEEIVLLIVTLIFLVLGVVIIHSLI